MEAISLSKKDRKLNKAIKNNNTRVQNFFEIAEIKDDHILTTRNEEKYFLEVKPKNITVLSKPIRLGIIDSLTNIISELPKSEILCLNNSQNYENNIRHLENLKSKENNAAIAALDIKDIEYMNNIKSAMSTSRSFFIILRTSQQDSRQLVNHALQLCAEQNFNVQLAEKKDIKKMLSIYLEHTSYDEELPDYDGEQYGLSKNESLKNFVDIIAPSIMDFKHRRYYIVGNTYRKVFAIRRYKTETEQTAILSEIGEMGGVTLHIYNERVTPSEQEKIFEKAERKNMGDIAEAKTMSKSIDSKENILDIEKILKESHRTKEEFIHCSVYVEVIANSLKELRDMQTKVCSTLNKNHIKYDELYMQQRDGFASVAPFGLDMFDKEFARVLPASSVANLFPFSYSGKTDPKGLFFGRAVHGGNILADIDHRDTDKTNGHIAIFGNSGEGKSFLIKLLICLFRQQQKKVYSMDSDKECIDVTNGLGGTNIDMLSGKYFINVMQPRLLNDPLDDSYTDDEPVAFKHKTIISQHIAFLKDFFKTYNPAITTAELDTLEIMLEELYKKFHITDRTDLNKLTNVDYPILSDLFKEVERQLNIYDEVSKINGKEMLFTKDTLRNLALCIRSICIGTDSTFFNGYTNIPNADHINFDVKNLLNTNENLKNAMYFNILSFMNNKFLTEGNTVVIVDELHEVIKSLIVIMYLRSFVKRGRKKNSNLVIASQNIEDLMIPGVVEYTKPFFSIPTHRFLFYPGTVNIKEYKAITNMLDEEWELIQISKRGHCLYCCGNERYYLQIIAPEYKKELFGTAGGK